MKKFSLIALMFVLGCVVGWNRPSFVNPVHAQVSSPSYACDFGPSGTTSVFPCTQYLVAVSPQRFGGGVIIWQVTDTPLPINGQSNLVAVASGPLSGTSVQAFVPGSTTSTFTLAESKP